MNVYRVGYDELILSTWKSRTLRASLSKMKKKKFEIVKHVQFILPKSHWVEGVKGEKCQEYHND